MPVLETVLKRFEEPDEVRTFEKGKFELVRIGGMTIGRATYQPGWKWSVHVGPGVGATRCNVEHVGLVLSGCATAAMEDGTIHELRAGMLFYIPPGAPGHDSLGGGRCSLRLATFSRGRSLREQVAQGPNSTNKKRPPRKAALKSLFLTVTA